jgi:hypothetical protein
MASCLLGGVGAAAAAGAAEVWQDYGDALLAPCMVSRQPLLSRERSGRDDHASNTWVGSEMANSSRMRVCKSSAKHKTRCGRRALRCQVAHMVTSAAAGPGVGCAYIGVARGSVGGQSSELAADKRSALSELAWASGLSPHTRSCSAAANPEAVSMQPTCAMLRDVGSGAEYHARRGIHRCRPKLDCDQDHSKHPPLGITAHGGLTCCRCVYMA